MSLVSGKEKGWSYYIVNPLWVAWKWWIVPLAPEALHRAVPPFRMAHRAS